MKRSLFLVAIAIASLSSLASAEDALDRLQKLEKDVDALPAKMAAAASTVTIDQSVVTIRASDVDDAVDAIMTERLRHPAKVVKLVIRKKTLEETAESIDESEEISVGVPLAAAFRQQIDLRARGDDELARLVKSAPTDWRKHLAYVEKKQGTSERHAHLRDGERARRATWLMMLPRNDLASVRFE